MISEWVKMRVSWDKGEMTSGWAEMRVRWSQGELRWGWDDLRVSQSELRWAWDDLRVSWDENELKCRAMISEWEKMRVSWDESELGWGWDDLGVVSEDESGMIWGWVEMSLRRDEGGWSRTKALFLQLQLSILEERLERKLRFHIFNSQFLRDASHEALFLNKGRLARNLRFHIFNFQFWDNPHGSLVFTSSTFSFWGTSSHAFSHLQLSVFEGHLARKLLFHIFKLQFLIVLEGRLSRKLRFHIFNFQFLRGVSHDSFVSQLEPSGFEGPLARKLRFHNFNFQFLQEVSQDMRFWKMADAHVLQHRTCYGRWMGKVCRAPVAKRSRVSWDHAPIGPAL